MAGLVAFAVFGAGPLAGQEVAELAVLGAAAFETGDAGDGGLAGVSARFAFKGRGFGIGPELLVLNGGSFRVRALSGVIRLRQGAGRARPYLVAGLGAYAWQTKVPTDLPVFRLAGAIDGAPGWEEARSLSGSLGVGLAIGPAGRHPELIVEARWHRNLSQPEGTGSRTLLVLGAGLQVGW